MQAKLIKQLDVNNQLGEGVLWDQKTGRIWWVDILNSQLFSYSLPEDDLKRWNTPEPICSFSLVDYQDSILAAFAGGLAWFNPANGKVEWIEKIESQKLTRLNDGKTDLDGNFWVGGVIEDHAPTGTRTALYRLDANLAISKPLSGMTISNSLCWSPCGKKLYHSDTPTQTIRCYDVNQNGDVDNAIDFAVTEPGCFPDGSTTDANGLLYNAEWGGGKVRCYNTDGSPNFDLKIPVSQPSCVAFAGRDLNLLAVTSAAVGVEHEPGAGSLFIYQTDRVGLHYPRFRRA